MGREGHQKAHLGQSRAGGRWGRVRTLRPTLGLLPHHSSASVTLSEEWAGLGTFISLTQRGGYIYFLSGHGMIFPGPQEGMVGEWVRQ